MLCGSGALVKINGIINSIKWQDILAQHLVVSAARLILVCIFPSKNKKQKPGTLLKFQFEFKSIGHIGKKYKRYISIEMYYMKKCPRSYTKDRKSAVVISIGAFTKYYLLGYR